MRLRPSSPLFLIIVLLGTFTSAFLTGTVSAGTVNITTLAAVPLRDEAGGVLSGNAIRVGTFDLSGAGLFIISNSNSFSRLDALFTPLAEGITDAGTITQANNSSQLLRVNDALQQEGEVLGQISRTSANYLPSGTQLYLWVFNNPDPELATEWGIYGSTSANWTLPTQLGSTTLSTASADLILRGTLNNDTLRLANNSALSYQTWLADSFSNTQLADPQLSSPSSDPDNDGTTNLAEYYFGTAPNTPDIPGPAFQVISSENQLELTWTRAVGVTDVIAIPQTSPDLVTWQNQAAVEISANSQSFTLPFTLRREFARLLFQLQ